MLGLGRVPKPMGVFLGLFGLGFFFFCIRQCDLQNISMIKLCASCKVYGNSYREEVRTVNNPEEYNSH
jgi:hypothetical protein